MLLPDRSTPRWTPRASSASPVPASPLHPGVFQSRWRAKHRHRAHPADPPEPPARLRQMQRGHSHQREARYSCSSTACHQSAARNAMHAAERPVLWLQASRFRGVRATRLRWARALHTDKTARPRQRGQCIRLMPPALCNRFGLKRFLRKLHQCPGAQRRTGTTVIPTGARAISASLMCWMPKGMPMIVMKQARAEVR